MPASYPWAIAKGNGVPWELGENYAIQKVVAFTQCKFIVDRLCCIACERHNLLLIINEAVIKHKVAICCKKYGK